MGKKSKSEKPKNKISVEVKRHHIETAHERLRVKFNERFNSSVEKGHQKLRDIEKEKKESENPQVSLPDREKIDYDELLENLSNILDFYRNEKIPRDVMISDNQIDPVLMAYNTLCDQGIKRTVSHGQQLHLPGDKFRILFMRAYYGRDNVAENQNGEEDGDLEERYQEVVKSMADKFLKNPTQIPSPEEAAGAMATAMAQSAVKKSQVPATTTVTTAAAADQSQDVQGSKTVQQETVDTSQTITDHKVDVRLLSEIVR